MNIGTGNVKAFSVPGLRDRESVGALGKGRGGDLLTNVAKETAVPTRTLLYGLCPVR